MSEIHKLLPFLFKDKYNNFDYTIYKVVLSWILLYFVDSNEESIWIALLPFNYEWCACIFFILILCCCHIYCFLFSYSRCLSAESWFLFWLFDGLLPVRIYFNVQYSRRNNNFGIFYVILCISFWLFRSAKLFEISFGNLIHT